MDFHRSRGEGHKPFSVLEGEGSYFHRILSREPSVGNSYRYYPYHNPGRIPFQWERQPGKCKFDPPKHPDNVPRISPPPTSASKSVESPPRPDQGGACSKGSPSSWLKMKFWRKIKIKKHLLLMPRSKDQAGGSGDTSKGNVNGSPCASSDDHLVSPSSNSSWSASSVSSASSSSFGAPPRSANSAKGHNDRPFQ